MWRIGLLLLIASTAQAKPPGKVATRVALVESNVGGRLGIVHTEVVKSYHDNHLEHGQPP
jgi:hypothetical protein